MLKFLFWILVGIIAYTYIGYVILLIVLNLFKRLIKSGRRGNNKLSDYPEATLLIAAYNERDIVSQKMRNSLSLIYPQDRLKILWVTDGSNDGTYEELLKYPMVQVLHQKERRGKTAALNRAMKFVKTPYVVFCDANSMLDPESIKILMNAFCDENVGCVAGAKHIAKDFSAIAAGAGEGLYWKYESFLKKLESDFHSALGAAGELYAIRTDLFSDIDPDLIIDDFVNSMKIALKGKTVKYAKNAYAVESPSLNIQEELKRKIRIATGGFQTLLRLPQLLNIFRYGFLSFEYFSHKVLRWTVVPWTFPILFIMNFLICVLDAWKSISFNMIMILQILFYLIVFAGAMLEKRSTRFKLFFISFYLIIMNYAQIIGLFKFLGGKHTVVWEKAKRS